MDGDFLCPGLSGLQLCVERFLGSCIWDDHFFRIDHLWKRQYWGALVKTLSLSLLESIVLYVPNLLHIHSSCTTDNSPPWTCVSIQPCFCGEVCEEYWCLLRLLCRDLWAILSVLVWMQPLASWSSRLWADQYTPPAFWQSHSWLGREMLIMVCPNLSCSILSHKLISWHWNTLTFCSRLTVSKDVKLV